MNPTKLISKKHYTLQLKYSEQHDSNEVFSNEQNESSENLHISLY